MKRTKVGLPLHVAVIILAVLGLASSGKSIDSGPGNIASSVPAAAMPYVAFAWNDLGMHCLNPTFDKAVILPPYNTLWVQVVKRGAPPQIVTSGVTVEYALRGNSFSYGKREYGQFWDNCLALFGVALAHDRGLNLEDPGIHNGLSGTMLVKGGHFQANGIPLVPVSDALAWDPYQVADITVKDSSTGAILVQTRATVPTSDEINCGKCHGADALLTVLVKHDAKEGTHLAAKRPVLCAGCHGTPALGISGPGSSGRYLSQAIHGFHASKGAACYDCHPGATTKCSRSVAHTAADGNCSACHGKMSDVAGSVAAGKRTPWLQEPTCVTCHPGIPEIDSGASLYRNAFGHHGVSCAACHGSPHAQVPSSQAADNYQPIQYQGKARPIGDCRVCHDSTLGGGGLDKFAAAHGGTRATACSVCHTAAPAANAAGWPHQFMWKKR
ncbi:MAG TPA: cytochrome c3 family protein [Acidobacteriota bacterium]